MRYLAEELVRRGCFGVVYSAKVYETSISYNGLFLLLSRGLRKDRRTFSRFCVSVGLCPLLVNNEIRCLRRLLSLTKGQQVRRLSVLDS